ncbi:DUF885 domain-containing protein [Vallicoccus soli]|uniref:DUF885 domain-containing protein n=1 Tax=Vallicoccus soli TaxID=2339232 RepID=A0A3A3ZK70_9ACTN|nr:DUF885 domain-containing protein [Vallicoccus soli]RJK96264.1 DUF885 domain-containing protein [Vallicoccus soli]
MPLPPPARPFDALALELAADQLEASPTLGSALGLTEHDERLPDLSAAAVAAREAREDAWLERFGALADGDLDDDERIDRDLVLMVLRGRRALRDWAPWRRSADTYAGTALSGVHGLLLHRLREPGPLARAVAARLDATPALLAQGEANLDPDLADPVLLRRSLGQVAAGAAYARSVAGQLDPDEARRAGVEEAGERAAAAYERFGAHLEELAGRARGSWALGEERYDALLRDAEGLPYGARAMRERGREAYDALLDDLRSRTAALRGGGDGADWRALLEELNADHAASPEELLAEYREATARARAFCAERDLVTLPDGEECRVVPSAPFTRGMLAVAHYIQPPPFAGRGTGHFFVPYPPEGATPEQVQQRLATNSRSTLWSITVHEAYPGHHWHFAWIASGRAPGGARVLRTLFGSTYVVEGWGLYSEDLMREQGFFTTPQQELAQRDMRLFRAARIVVDTSLHLGEMSVEEAVEHMATRTSLSRETARAEVLRYCAWPTQAASYLTGALEIARLRERWLAEGRGTLRAFHDRAAGSGRLPVSLMERSLFGRAEPAGTGG